MISSSAANDLTILFYAIYCYFLLGQYLVLDSELLSYLDYHYYSLVFFLCLLSMANKDSFIHSFTLNPKFACCASHTPPLTSFQPMSCCVTLTHWTFILIVGLNRCTTSCITHAFYLSSCMALSAGQSPREMYSRSTPSTNGVCKSC